MGETHRLGVGLGADLAGAAQAGQLLGQLAEPQLVEDRRRILEARRRRVAARAGRAQLTDQARDARVECGIAEPVVEDRAVQAVVAELLIELVDRIGSVGAIPRHRAFDPRSVAVPDLHLAVARPHEQDVTLLDVRRIEDRDGVGLVEAGEEEEVGGLAEIVVGIGVPHDLLGSRDDREPLADGVHEAQPAFGEWLVHT